MKRIIIVFSFLVLSGILLAQEKIYNGKYFNSAIGYGISYGGIGVNLNWRFGDLQGYGFHIGAGYFPGNSLLASGGIRFYPYKGFYFDVQFGLTGYENYTDQNFKSVTNLLYGPSFMVGSNLYFGDKKKYGINLGLGYSYMVNAKYWDKNQFVLDIGFVVKY